FVRYKVQKVRENYTDQRSLWEAFRFSKISIEGDKYILNFFKSSKNKTAKIDTNIPTDPVDRNLEGKKLEKLGQVDRAIEFYEENVKDEFEGDFPYNRLATIYRKRKQYKEEIRVLNQAISVFEKENINSNRQDIIPKLDKFKERLSKAKDLERNS